MPRWPDDVQPEFPEAQHIRPDDPRYATLEDIQKARARAATLRSVVSIALMAIGGILISAGAGYAWGWPYGVGTAGLLVFVIGLFIGLSA